MCYLSRIISQEYEKYIELVAIPVAKVLVLCHRSSYYLRHRPNHGNASGVQEAEDPYCRAATFW